MHVSIDVTITISPINDCFMCVISLICVILLLSLDMSVPQNVSHKLSESPQVNSILLQH